MSASSTCCASRTISKATLSPFGVGLASEPRVVVSQIAISRLILPVGREDQTAKLTRRRLVHTFLPHPAREADVDGSVEARDEAEAREKALKQLDIKPADQFRLACGATSPRSSLGG